MCRRFATVCLIELPTVRSVRACRWHYRTEASCERTCEAHRLGKVLDDAGSKLSPTVSNLLGVSGRALPDALIAGERAPHVLADLAKGSTHPCRRGDPRGDR